LNVPRTVPLATLYTANPRRLPRTGGQPQQKSPPVRPGAGRRICRPWRPAVRSVSITIL
jgi:hypothetical protein